MPNIALVDTAQEFQAWLNEDEVKEILDELPKEVADKIYQFAEDCVSEMDDISNAIDAASDLIDQATRDMQEISSAVYNAESSIEEAQSALEDF